ncbi:MAG: hypothetical protein K0U84_11535, partial [Actinomycetia bacterium]|nr:hypothetical protein [Actinomycetes bacterium]
ERCVAPGSSVAGKFGRARRVRGNFNESEGTSTKRWLFPSYAVPWSELVSLGYFAGVGFAALIVGVLVVNRRDARRAR